MHLSLENHKVRGLRNILIHALLCIIAMLLTAFTAIKHGKPRTNKGNNKADIKLTRKHQFSNTLARILKGLKELKEKIRK
jgi:hypothetical protein